MPKHSLAYTSITELPTVTAVNVTTSDKAIIFDTSANSFALTEPTLKGRKPITTMTSTGTLTTANFGDLIALSSSTGLTATLPTATGSGGEITFFVQTLLSSGSYVVNCPGQNFHGSITSVDDTGNNAVGFNTIGQDNNTLTLNGSTTGGACTGDCVTFTDYAASKYMIRGTLSNTGTPSTPISKV